MYSSLVGIKPHYEMFFFQMNVVAPPNACMCDKCAVERPLNRNKKNGSMAGSMLILGKGKKEI